LEVSRAYWVRARQESWLSLSPFSALCLRRPCTDSARRSPTPSDQLGSGDSEAPMLAGPPPATVLAPASRTRRGRCGSAAWRRTRLRAHGHHRSQPSPCCGVCASSTTRHRVQTRSESLKVGNALDWTRHDVLRPRNDIACDDRHPGSLSFANAHPSSCARVGRTKTALRRRAGGAEGRTG
jgi:hypothetical protein